MTASGDRFASAAITEGGADDACGAAGAVPVSVDGAVGFCVSVNSSMTVQLAQASSAAATVIFFKDPV